MADDFSSNDGYAPDMNEEEHITKPYEPSGQRPLGQRQRRRFLKRFCSNRDLENNIVSKSLMPKNFYLLSNPFEFI